MRHWLVILMILFTPLRVVAADMMAIGMAAQQGQATYHAVAPAAAATPALPHADCGEHAAPVGHATAAPLTSAGEHPTAAAEGSCATCASCMVCSAAALAIHSGVPAALPLRHMLPVPGNTSFHSAAALPGFKPPIS